VILKQPIFTHFCDKKERIVTDRLVNFVFVYLLIWLVLSLCGICLAVTKRVRALFAGDGMLHMII
jgi:hypothetical protein